MQQEHLFIYKLSSSPYFQRLLEDTDTDVLSHSCVGLSYHPSPRKKGAMQGPQLCHPMDAFSAPHCSVPLPFLPVTFPPSSQILLAAPGPFLTSKVQSAGEGAQERERTRRRVWEGAVSLLPTHSAGKVYPGMAPVLWLSSLLLSLELESKREGKC